MARLGSFRDLYPEELVVSAVARTCAAGEIKSKELKKLFRISTIRPGVAFPLRRLMEALPPGHRYTSQNLLWNHTPAPFYFPFLGVDLSFLAAGIYVDGRMPQTLLAKRGIGADVPFRMCERCVKEDRDRQGEAFWHRSHHLLGVPICPKHRCPLLVGDFRLGAMLRQKFFPLESVLQEFEGVSWLPEPAISEPLNTFLAQWSTWLLERGDSILGYANLLLSYRSRFRRLDGATQSAVIEQIAADCDEIWLRSGKRVFAHIARWFGKHFDDANLKTSDVSATNHLLVCRALRWTPAEAMAWLPPEAVVASPFKSRKAKSQMTYPLYGFEKTVDQDKSDARLQLPSRQSHSDSNRRAIAFLARAFEHRLDINSDFGRRFEDLSFKGELVVPLEDEEQIEDDVRDFRRCLPMYMEVLRERDVATFTSENLYARVPPFIFQDLPILSILGEARKFLRHFRGFESGRVRIDSDARGFHAVLEREAPLWYHCEFRPRLRLMMETTRSGLDIPRAFLDPVTGSGLRTNFPGTRGTGISSPA